MGQGITYLSERTSPDLRPPGFPTSWQKSENRALGTVSRRFSIKYQTVRGKSPATELDFYLSGGGELVTQLSLQ